MSRRALVLLLALGFFLGWWLSPGRAYSAEPYGGCVEAIQYPASAGAQDCRDAGWRITSTYVIGPRGWLRATTLPACQAEDSTRCYWNAQWRGNGKGDSFLHLSRYLIVLKGVDLR